MRAELACTIDASGPLTPAFNGDFGAHYASYAGLSVRSYRRGDLGRSGSAGTGFAAWANQAGDGSAMAPGSSNSADGIGSAGAGMNGKGSVVTNGTTQNGSYTHPTGITPGATAHLIYTIERVLVTPTTVGYMHSANTFPVVYVAGAQSSPAADMICTNGGGSLQTTGVVINQWYRGLALFTGSGSDVFRMGAHTTVSASMGASAIGTQWGYGAAYNGTVLVSLETVLIVHVEGPAATLLTAAFDADPKARAFWSSAIEI